MSMAGLGIVLGGAAAFGATRVMKELLFGVSATNPLTFGAVAFGPDRRDAAGELSFLRGERRRCNTIDALRCD